MDQSQEKTPFRMTTKPYSVLFIAFFLMRCSVAPEFKAVTALYSNFDQLLSPKDYAATAQYKKNEAGLWEKPDGSLVTIDIPFKSHFLRFGSRYKATHTPLEGVYSDHVLRYEKGVVTRQFYRLTSFPFQGTQYESSYYIVYFSPQGVFEKAALYDAQGNLILETNYNFLIA